MDVETRIKRRRRSVDGTRLVEDYGSLAPVVHVDDPAGRGPFLEGLFDYLDPVFDGQLPANGYVFGPSGSGKSAVVTALFGRLDQLLSERRPVIHTMTRARPLATPFFVFVDARAANSEFGFYHAVVDALLTDPVPETGIGTGTLQSRLQALV